MMERGRIRLFEGVESNRGSIVGFSPSVAEASIQAISELETYLSLSGRRQTVRKIDVPEGLKHIPGVYLEIQPPLEEEQIRRIARICIKHADNQRNVVEFIDNRQMIPERPLQPAGEVIYWVD